MTTPDPEGRIAAAIRKRREELEFESAKAMAEHFGFSPSSFRRWESGKRVPSDTYRVQLAERAGVDIPDDLLPDEHSQLQLEDDDASRNRVTARTPANAGPRTDRVRDLMHERLQREERAREEIHAAILRTIRQEYMAGRLPLFVLGAGMSDRRVPFLSDMVRGLASRLEEVISEVDIVPPPVSETYELATSVIADFGHDTRQATRDDVAALFRSIVHAPSPMLREAREQFSKDLLLRGITSADVDGGMLDAEPTGAHRELARLLSENRAYALSLNFDRLTWRALHDRGEHGVVLQKPKEIRRYFCSDREDLFPSLVQIRGDVLAAVCLEEACPYDEFSVPSRNNWTNEDDRLECPECKSGSLVAKVSFPGERRKEEESKQILRQFESYVASRVGSIVFVGVSGHWDKQLLDWAFSLAEERDLETYHIKKSERPSFIAQFQRQFYGECVPCRVLVEDKEEFFADFGGRIAPPELHDPKWGERIHEYKDLIDIHKFIDDDVWISDAALKVDEVSVEEEDFATVYCPGSVQRYLERIAQLTLVDKLVKGGDIPHSRWDHSVGTTLVGTAWFKRLKESSHVCDDALGLPVNAVGNILKHALLLHDCGHLPFSHVSERVLTHINWVPARFDDLEMDVLRQRLSSRGDGESRGTGEDRPELGRIVEYIHEKLRATGLIDLSRERVVLYLSEAARGRSGWPWFNAVCNSPVDADKIDYLTRDRLELGRGGFGSLLGGRLGEKGSGRTGAEVQWLEDFFAEQEVTENGAIVLHGKSAVAAADLWRQRFASYDRFYYAPEIRVYERMASELVEQYVIRYVMGPQDWDSDSGDVSETLWNPDYERASRTYWDLRPVKERIVRAHLERLLGRARGRSEREKKLLETFIVPRLLDGEGGRVVYDQEYLELLERMWGALKKKLEDDEDRWPSEALDHLVGEPIRVEGVPISELREAVRPVQHRYCRYVLVDIVSSPTVLTGAATYRKPDMGSIFGNIIVPQGRAESWHAASEAGRPLSREAVAGIEERFARIVVISPGGGRSPMAEHAYERVKERCRSLGAEVEIEEV